MKVEKLLTMDSKTVNEVEKEWKPTNDILVVKIDSEDVTKGKVWMFDKDLYSFDDFIREAKEGNTMIAMWEVEAGKYDTHFNEVESEKMKFLLDEHGDDTYLVVSSNKLPIDLILISTLNALEIMYQQMECEGEEK